MMQSEKIQNIEVDKVATWENKIFLTFDLDWCSDQVLAYSLDILEKYNVKATLFVTHKTPLLDRMRANKNIELGIHPNFNPLLSGDFKYGKNINEVVKFYKNIVPEAISVRSHSFAQSSNIITAFADCGLKFDSNMLIPVNSGVSLRPWEHWTPIIQVPCFWADDVHFRYGWQGNIQKYSDVTGLKVFCFHPIHVYLNTEGINRYESARPYFHSVELLKHQNTNNYGTDNFLRDLIKGLVI